MQTSIQQLQKQLLNLPVRDCWQLVQVLLESLQQETRPASQQRHLSRLRGIAKNTANTNASSPSPEEDYASYLSEKYQ